MLNQLPEGPVKEYLKKQPKSFANEMARRYLAADAKSRQDIDDFFIYQGPEKVHQSKLKFKEGIPTSWDLEGWLR